LYQKLISLASALFHHKTIPLRKQLEHSTKSKLCVGFPQTSDDLVFENISEDFKILMDIAVTFTAYWRALDSRTRTTTSTRFSHRATLSARKPTSFWREKRDTVVILVRGFAKMLSRQNKSRTR